MGAHFRGLNLSFETGDHLEGIDDAWPSPTLDLLRALKTKYDPDNVFRDNFNIAQHQGRRRPHDVAVDLRRRKTRTRRRLTGRFAASCGGGSR